MLNGVDCTRLRVGPAPPLPLGMASSAVHLQVVTKLFHIVEPDVAVFGRKDFQQWRVVCRMVRDLDMAVHIIGVPVAREPDGLAMSRCWLVCRQGWYGMCSRPLWKRCAASWFLPK